LGCAGFCCGLGAACDAEAENGGINDIFCLISSSKARNAVSFCAISSCLAASWSMPRLMALRLAATGSSCCVGLMEVVAAIGGFGVDMDTNQASVGACATSICPATSP
jgi:hypothetical protein